MRSSLDCAAWYVQELSCRVFMPEYRLTPGNPYPVPIWKVRWCSAFRKKMAAPIIITVLFIVYLIVYGLLVAGSAG